jgi:serine/threonine protein kinase
VWQYLEGGLSMVYDKDTRTFSSPLSKGVMPQDLACKLFFGLLSGLQYLHGRRICHRDIKVRRSCSTETEKRRL